MSIRKPFVIQDTFDYDVLWDGEAKSKDDAFRQYRNCNPPVLRFDTEITELTADQYTEFLKIQPHTIERVYFMDDVTA